MNPGLKPRSRRAEPSLAPQEFASPERIIGGEVDIRSDLYSLGVSLWQMLTAQVPFGGSLAVVMAQHQHAALPLEKLAGVPQPVANLIEVLLVKILVAAFRRRLNFSRPCRR